MTRAHYRLVWAALSFVTRLPRPIEQNCVIQVVRVSGTIKKAEEEAIRRAKATILQATARERGSGAMLNKMLGESTKEMQKSIVSDDEDGDEMDQD